MPKHFTDESWADYVRGLSPAAEADAIETHLRNECGICVPSFRLWQAVADIGGEARIEVPEENMRAIRAAFLEWWRRHALPRRARVARLIFDSMRQPLPAGVRSAGASPRRLLARGGAWSVDLRVDASAAPAMFLAGQVLGSGKNRGPAKNAVVLLMSGDAVIAETSSNQFGEFELQFDRKDELRLYIEIAGGRPIGIVLPQLVRRSAPGDPHPN